MLIVDSYRCLNLTNIVITVLVLEEKLCRLVECFLVHHSETRLCHINITDERFLSHCRLSFGFSPGEFGEDGAITSVTDIHIVVVCAYKSGEGGENDQEYIFGVVDLL